MGDTPLGGLSLGVGGPVKAVSFTDEQLKNLGTDFSSRAKDVDGLIHGTGSIGIDPPAFGVLGMGLNSAHDRARDGAVNLLKVGKEAIDSWNEALKSSAANYKAAEEASTPKETGGPGPGDLGGGLGDLGGGLGGGLKGGGLGPGDLGGGPGGLDGLDDRLKNPTDDLKLPGDDLKLPGDSGKDPNLPDPDLPDDSTKNPNLPDPNLPDPGKTDPNLPNPNLPDPTLPGTDLPDPSKTDTNLPGLGVDDPTKTALSSYNPPNLGNPGDVTTTQPRLPGTTTWTGDTAGPGSSGRAGSFSGVGGSGSLPLGGLPGTGTGSGGAGGIPMMPMMPGSGGGDQGQEREKSTWMSEDEGVWGGDEDIAPPVIGQE
ncbi:hypothetical protein [Streptosporangium saharense]|uniref:hypothetical protein n=1 Tax=Streptosporangium saharense TaxID=1706840 RepID=UPI00343EA054